MNIMRLSTLQIMFIIIATSNSLAQSTTLEDEDSLKEQDPLVTETPQINSTRYRRFHANDSLIGQPVPCSRQEKLCFQENLLYYPKWDKCVSLGGVGDDKCEFHADKEEFLHGSGRLVAACDAAPLQRCPRGLGVRMALDGRCYAHAFVRDELCACADRTTLHPLGGHECRCRSSTKTRPAPTQPDEDGQCVVPDLQSPQSSDRLVSGNGFPRGGRATSFICDADQRRCFAEGAVWLPASERCHPPASAAPACPPGHVVGLVRDARLKGRAEGGCVPEDGGCPPGYSYIRMAFNGECHDKELIRLIAPGRLHLNLFGEHDASVYYSWGPADTFINLAVVDEACVINVTLYHFVTPPHGIPPVRTTISPEIIAAINANRPSPE